MLFSSIFQYLIPKDKKVFFPLFNHAAANVVAMATILVDAVNSEVPATREEMFKQINKLEHKSDKIIHQVNLELSKNFMTPFNREDIHALSAVMDDVAGNIQGAANKMNLYRIDDFNEHILKLSDFTLLACIELEKAIQELQELKNVRAIADSCIRINNLESQADDVFDRAVADLFLYEKDAIRLIKYKDVLSALENATDMCEDAADVMESILVKNT